MSEDATPFGEEWSGLGGMNKVLEHRVRLATCVLLTRFDRLTFRRLKELTSETDGSLGAHLTRLEKEKFVRVQREFRGGRPTSWYQLTDGGREALGHHVQGLEQLLRHRKEGEANS